MNLRFLLFITIAGFAINNAAAQNVSFTVDTASGCVPVTVHFTNTSTIGDSFVWHLDTVITTTTKESITRTFTRGDYFGVVLEAFDLNGNFIATYSMLFNLAGSSGDFYISKNIVCPNDSITIGGGRSSNNNHWNFGDGQAGSAFSSSIKHAYTDTGRYNITLISNSACGIDTVIKQVEVINSIVPPVPQFSPTVKTSCPEDLVLFSTGILVDPVKAYAWNYGDGTALSNIFNHSYSSPGEYPVTLTITNNCGLQNSYTDTVIVSNNTLPIKPNFSTPYQVIGCPGKQFQFYYYSLAVNHEDLLWNFGDGDTSSIWNIIHTYAATGEYTVTLTVTNTCGNINSSTKKIKVTDSIIPYTPWFQVLQDTLCPGDALQFNPDSWLQQESSDYLSVWNYGDGTIDTTFTPGHAYTATGTYVVSLTYILPCGASSSASQTVVVTSSARPLIPYFSIDGACPGDEIKLQPNINAGSFGQVYPYKASLYVWDFGDGTSEVTTNSPVSHSYSDTGIYNIKLTTVNSCFNTGSFSGAVNINNNIIPSASFYWLGANTIAPCRKIFYTVQNTSFNTMSRVVNSYHWNFGNGVTIDTDSESVAYAYPDTGNYTISLTATNECGNTVTETRKIVIAGICIGNAVNNVSNNNSANLYPNPFSASATLEVPEPFIKNGGFTLYNILGTEVMKLKIRDRKTEILRGDLPAGIYFYRLNENNTSTALTGKLVIQ